MTQTELGDFFYSTATTTESFTKTIVLPLETSNRKTAYLRDSIDAWQEVAERMAALVKSHQPSQWDSRTTNSLIWQSCNREFPDYNGLKAHVAHEASRKVHESYDSWQSNGRPSDNHPAGQFGEGQYMTLPQDSLDVARNNRGYGAKVGAVPYSPEWFHIKTTNNDRLEAYCGRIADENDSLRLGRGEIRLSDEDEVTLHLSITESIEVYEPGDVNRFLGVDLGERALYTTALVDASDDERTISAVTVESGREFRHTRKRLQQKRDHFQQQGDKPAEMACSDERERYTDHMTHVKTREVVDIAVENAPCVIVLEELTNYRATAKDPIHDWPFNQLQEKIMYKATEEGIPTTKIDPARTSYTCRKCGCEEPMNRSGPAFSCLRCGYEVHADVNAAINIALKAI